jgi:hypothetical protein
MRHNESNEGTGEDTPNAWPGFITWRRRIFSFVAASTTLLSVTSAASAATTPVTHGGTIHIYSIGTSSSQSQNVVITGAFADAGTLTVTGNATTVNLSKGNIVINLAQGVAAENKLFNHLAKFVSPSTCGINTSYSAPVKLVSGTGAYAGISGTVQVRTAEIGVFPKSASGRCNLSSNAQPVGFLSLAQGSGPVKFKSP